ncbi:MAG TPA: CBO0543 family protein [Niallia sp.]|nr:CBO0543 family protein [Niallia sp.]
MTTSQNELINQFRELGKVVDNLSVDYWTEYASFNTWQFWLNLIFLFVPLLVLLRFIDRSQIFRILFFGFTIHALMNYFDSIAVGKGFVFHPYPIFPLFDINLSVNTSFIPVTFMLFYQYGVNKKKNMYIVGLVAALFTGIILGSLDDAIDLLRVYKGTNIFFIFLVDYIEFLLAYWLTCFFNRMRKKQEEI